MDKHLSFIGIMLEVSTENFEQFRSLVNEWNADCKRVLERGEGLGDTPEMWVTVFLEPDTPDFAFDALMDKVVPLALPGTLSVSRGRAPLRHEMGL